MSCQDLVLAFNARDEQTTVTACRSCGRVIQRNFAVSFVNYEEGRAYYVDPEATYYHRNCLRIMKRAAKAKMTSVSPVPFWDALRSWFAGEEAAGDSEVALQERLELPPLEVVPDEKTEETERRRENAEVFALADKDWQDAGWK